MGAQQGAPPAEEETAHPELRGSTRPERYLAAGFDNIFSMLLVICIGAALSENVPTSKSTAVNAAIGFGLFGVYFAYFLLFESIMSTTPGKLIFSLRVQHLDGSKCSWRAAFVRTMTRFLEVNPFLFGCLPAAIVVRCSQRKQRWGDMLANTIVADK